MSLDRALCLRVQGSEAESYFRRLSLVFDWQDNVDGRA